MGLLLVIAGAGVWVTLIAPVIDDAKQRDGEREAAAHAAFRRTESARLVRDQRPRRARSARVARLYATGNVVRARTALLADLQRDVLRDARARERSGEIDPPVIDVACSVRREDPPPRVRVGFAATTKTSRISVGQSFLAAGSLRDGRYAWCHENPGPGEGATGRGVSVELSRSMHRSLTPATPRRLRNEDEHRRVTRVVGM